MRNLEYVCLGFPNDWYKVDENLMELTYFFTLQSIQGQLGLLERLKKLSSNSSNING